MAQFIAIITLINQLFPLIIQTVKAVESAFPAGGQGAAKMAIVQGVIQHALEVSTDLQVTAAQIVPVLTPIINGVVAMLNATGIFTRGTPATA
jgi:hypothetical protein